MKLASEVMKIRRPVFLFATLCCVNAETLGGGSAVNGVSARAQGMQNAYTAVSRDASSIFYNPGGLAFVKGSQVQVSGQMVQTDIGFDNQAGTSRSDEMINGINAFFASDEIWEPVVVGVGLYVPFGRVTEYDNRDTFGATSHRGEILRLDLAPTVAFRLHPRVTAGVGLTLSYVELETDILTLEEEASGTGYTFHAGLMWQISDSVNFGATYRGYEEADISGKGRFEPSAGLIAALGLPPGLPAQEADFDADLAFPSVWSVGLAWQANPKLLIAGTYEREEWSRASTFVREYENNAILSSPLLSTTEFNADDSTNLRLGAAYKFRPDHQFYAGIATLEAAVAAESNVPAMPDFDIKAFSLGYSYTRGAYEWDVVYERLDSDNTDRSSFPFTGSVELQANSLMFGFRYDLN